ncbi:DNA-processing protein DprA [Agromyces sp. Marseille-P2726]|uniref:DNA-processing protein DprA n=1 Tax=Agromyces sp. Marseille-P2726 TaxID=2709132 RepID=UPI00157061DF|nr:DNA-processing protein DprA [Agromyces sp. Marseille-P2726]
MNVLERSARHSAVEFEAVHRGPLDLDAFARAVLGHLAEPGDGVLGRLIDALGAAGAAEMLLERVSGRALSDAVAEAGGALDEREARSGLERWLPRLDHSAFLRSIAQGARVSAALVVPGDAAWPAQFDELGVHAPIGLWVRGRPDALAGDEPSIALVGARAATGYGEHVAMEASAGLVDRGFTIVSGGAYGIDGMAHRAALASNGTTVAFLAGGVDRFYPLGHESLLSRIVDTGAVMSEVPCGTAPTKWRFLQRNRLIAASADATVVLEAGMRSGSLNTAGHAAQLGRPLGAVPGPVTSPASAGCHRLLREFNAVCVVDADQMAELAGGSRVAADTGTSEPAPDVLRITDALSTRSPRGIEDLVRRTGMSVHEVMAALGMLELSGAAVRHPDGWTRRRSSRQAPQGG